MKKKRILCWLLALTFMFNVYALCGVVRAEEFTDVSSGRWSYDAIQSMSSQGIIEGDGTGRFLPTNAVNRAEFAKMFVLALHLQNEDGVEINFSDVKGTSYAWALKYIPQAANYITYYRSGDQFRFEPGSAAVREDMAYALVKALGYQSLDYDEATLNRFSDKDEISNDLKKYVAIAVEKGIMSGNADGTFDPKGTLTREQAAMLLFNVLEKIDTNSERKITLYQGKEMTINGKKSNWCLL